jgi:Icc-related predicted phosphoesterase
MRIVTIADTHGSLPDIPPCDLLIHAGDICPATDHSQFAQMQFLSVPFANWLSRVPAQSIIVVPGNHDYIFQKYSHLVPTNLRCKILNDSVFELDHLVIFGSPWTPYFFDWAFNGPYDPMEADAFFERKWSFIPEKTQIVITHGPPSGIRDLTYRINNAGEYNLKQRILTIKPLLHVFGHIHYSYGVERVEHEGSIITFVNASYLGEDYKTPNKILQFDLKDGKIIQV